MRYEGDCDMRVTMRYMRVNHDMRYEVRHENKDMRVTMKFEI